MRVKVITCFESCTAKNVCDEAWIDGKWKRILFAKIYACSFSEVKHITSCFFMQAKFLKHNCCAALPFNIVKSYTMQTISTLLPLSFITFRKLAYTRVVKNDLLFYCSSKIDAVYFCTFRNNFTHYYRRNEIIGENQL